MSSRDGVVLEVDGLRMRHADNDVLRDVTFQARRGEVLVMLGPNGAGKTTTIEILEGFRKRSAEAFQSWASTLRRATSGGGPGSASYCSRGATVPSGGSETW